MIKRSTVALPQAFSTKTTELGGMLQLYAIPIVCRKNYRLKETSKKGNIRFSQYNPEISTSTGIRVWPSRKGQQWQRALLLLFLGKVESYVSFPFRRVVPWGMHTSTDTYTYVKYHLFLYVTYVPWYNIWLTYVIDMNYNTKHKPYKYNDDSYPSYIDVVVSSKVIHWIQGYPGIACRLRSWLRMSSAPELTGVPPKCMEVVGKSPNSRGKGSCFFFFGGV